MKSHDDNNFISGNSCPLNKQCGVKSKISTKLFDEDQMADNIMKAGNTIPPKDQVQQYVSLTALQHNTIGSTGGEAGVNMSNTYKNNELHGTLQSSSELGEANTVKLSNQGSSADNKSNSKEVEELLQNIPKMSNVSNEAVMQMFQLLMSKVENVKD